MGVNYLYRVSKRALIITFCFYIPLVAFATPKDSTNGTEDCERAFALGSESKASSINNPSLQGAYQQQDLIGSDLSGVDLSYKDFSLANLFEAKIHGGVHTKVNFLGANLENIEIRNSQFNEYSNFQKTNMKGSYLLNIIFKGSDFKSADLSFSTMNNVDFSNLFLEETRFFSSHLTNVNFQFANLFGAIFSKSNPEFNTNHESVVTELNNVNFSYSNLKLSSFVSVKLTNVQFVGANLEYVVFKRVRFINVDFQSSNLSYANLSSEVLVGANFQEAILEDAQMNNSDLTGANFFKAHLRGANLRKSTLKKSNLMGAFLVAADFQGANLEGADLSDTDLSYVNFKNANLEGADLTGANITGAIFEGARFQKLIVR